MVSISPARGAPATPTMGTATGALTLAFLKLFTPVFTVLMWQLNMSIIAWGFPEVCAAFVASTGIGIQMLGLIFALSTISVNILRKLRA